MNKTLETIKLFRWNSVFFKTLKRFIIILMIPFLIISAYFSLYYYNKIEKEYTDLAINDFSRLYRVFDQLLSGTDHIFYTLCSDISLDTYFSIKDPDKVNAQEYAMITRLYNQLNTQAYIYESIHSIQLYRDSGHILSSNINGSVISPLTDEDLAGMPDTTEFLLPCTLTDTEGNSSESFAVCYNYYHSGQQRGYIVMNIDSESILRELPSESVLTVFNFQNNPVFRSNPDCTTQYSSCTTSGEIPQVSQHNSTLQFTSQLRNSCLYLETPSVPGIHMSSFFVMTLLCILLSFITAFLLSLLVSMDSYHMLQNIIFNIDSCDEASIQQRASINELTYISDNIMQLHTKNQSLETVLANKMNEMRQMQNAMLQLQFTPHFLFNTLNAVNMIALRELGPENEIEHITVLLCDLLSQALNTNRYIISVREELDYTEKYVEIEQIKSKNNFDTIWNIDSSIMEYKIPKLIFQPLVENAFRHGIKYLPPEKRGKLTITGKQEENNIIFEIEDNGIGIPSDKLNGLKNRLNNDTIGESHIGLMNVNSRIKLFYGNTYGLDISSEPGKTVIRIKIPKKKFE